MIGIGLRAREPYLAQGVRGRRAITRLRGMVPCTGLPLNCRTHPLPRMWGGARSQGPRGESGSGLFFVKHHCHRPHSFAHPSARFFRRLQQTLMPPQTKALPIDGASVTTFDRFGDHRGYFNELYNEEKYDGLSAPGERWKQVSFSSSQKHALRGLHCSPHGKFITCVRGSFYDVIADFRDGSPTFGRWCGVLLTDKNKKQECRRR